MSLVARTVKMIEVSDWDKLVADTYGRVYSFQQQDDCKPRGIFKFSVPETPCEDYEVDTVPEEVNHEDMGVSFAAWLKRDPKQKLSNPDDQADYCLSTWWDRNFYPAQQMVANDLHAKGLLEAGDYVIDIDW